MRIIIYQIVLFCLLTNFCFGAIRAGNLNQNNDKQIWSENNVHVQLSEKWSLIIHAGLRWGDDYRRLFFFRQWNILQYDLTDSIREKICIEKNSIFQSFTIGPTYSKTWAIQGNRRGIRHWANSNRFGLMAFMTHEWRGWSLQQRLFGEYIEFVTPHYRDHGVYRHRVVLSSPWKFTCYKINPFLSNEWFFRSEDRKHGIIVQSGPFYENRIRLGASIQLSKKVQSDIWWQWRTIKQLPNNRPLWRNTYQIGITLNLQH